MASCLVRFGRFAFFVLFGLQAYSLASYPAKYKENDGYYGLTALFLPAFVLRLYIMISNKHLQWLFVVWLLYVIGLVIFTFLGDLRQLKTDLRGLPKAQATEQLNQLYRVKKHNQRNRLDYISKSLNRFNLLDGTKQNGVFWSKCPKDDPLSHSASSATSSKYRDGLNSLQRADVDVVSTHCTRPVRWR